MTSETIAAHVSRHAAERIVERSGLASGSVQALLDNGQFFWACDPLPDKNQYALVYDSCTSRHFVAVLGANSRTVVTLLTLEQFENDCGHPVAPVRLQLARLALLKESTPAPSLVTAPPAPELRVLWRFSLYLNDQTKLVLGQFDHDEVCRRFLFVLPPQSNSGFSKRALRVAQAPAFGAWLLGALPKEATLEQVVNAEFEALDPVTGEPLWQKGVTAGVVAGLEAGPDSLLAMRLQRKARAAREAARTRMKQERRLQRQTAKKQSPHEVRLA